ncbi:MAG TPA: RNA-binding S4 domain-containing protein [Hyphomicrobiaceae bacterium]|nr:RNA-binding S4 domain-containing protein [Hyphomicrobiaceae bacterium]
MARSTKDGDDDAEADGSPAGTQRLDKWLWYTRLIKSRTLAASLVSEGKIRVNKERITKPAQAIRPGDVITASIQRTVRIVKVVALGARRGPASEAQTLYQELDTSGQPLAAQEAEPREKSEAPPMLPPERPRGMGRPTKRDRRLLDTFHGRRR